MRAVQNDRGLTLLELVIAMSVFALVAIMGLQSLTGMLRTRDSLMRLDTETAALSKGLALLRNDLGAIMPLAFYPTGGGFPRPAIESNPSVVDLAMTLGGQTNPLSAKANGETHRSEWKLNSETGELSRGIWLTIIPANIEARAPDVVVLSGVSALSVRSYWIGQGWVQGLQNPLLVGTEVPDGDGGGVAPEVYSDILPTAVEVTLKMRDHGDIPLIQSLR
ncbi:MAG: general secretion pathway protein J [Candidatus Azotimanducaceae bacterium]